MLSGFLINSMFDVLIYIIYLRKIFAFIYKEMAEQSQNLTKWPGQISIGYVT